MRLAYVSHSLVADRQRLFGEELRRQLAPHGGEVVEVYPEAWGRHLREGGVSVSHPGRMRDFLWGVEGMARILGPRPDVVLLQQEPYCASAQQVMDACVSAAVPVVVFAWENSPGFRYDGRLAGLVNTACRAAVFGNSEALEVAEASGIVCPSRVLPQVGFDPAIFRPSLPGDPHPGTDILFAGRAGDPMKGEAVLDLAVSGSGWSVRKLHAEYADDRSSPYAALGAKYRSARVTCTPSRDLPERSREQFAPAVNVESLMCGTPVVTTDQPAIEEWLEGCPAVRWARQDHTDSLRAALSDAFLIDDDERASGAAWAREGFSNEAVARRWLRILWEAAS